MINAFIFILFLLLIIAGILGIHPLTNLRRRRIKRRIFPFEWLMMIERNVPLYKRLPASLQQRLQEHINVLLTEKKFKGCGGLEITDEIKLTIAAQAALLLLNERGTYFSKLHLILVYPSAFIANQTTAFGEQYLEEIQVKSGESWQIGIVVLSWEDIKRDALNWKDGRNVILHEFAHQLDQESGHVSGVPILAKQSDYVSWGRVFRKEYEKLCSEVEQGVETVIDEYGATNPAEFFAVVTETFFEKPFQMKREHPELYQELKRYYQLEPTDWLRERV
ncbi:MAG TPA: M90 family metallopeptidase [Stenomitos sp.]